mmetsp:Transcript_6340/g.10817  ORF Transcript_6340/g.10817 Transcript_6340/m.10817 type:complete len:823 (+) Transcript_6340:127-2595(+)
MFFVFRYLVRLFEAILWSGSEFKSLFATDNTERTKFYDFLLEFSPGVSIGGGTSPAEQERGQVALQVLDSLRKNGLRCIRVKPSRHDCCAFAIRGNYQTLLKQAEKMKLRKLLKDEKHLGRTALFTMARVVDFDNSDQEGLFFCSGERLMLLEELVLKDEVITNALGMEHFNLDSLDDIKETQREKDMDAVEGKQHRKGSAFKGLMSKLKRKRPVKVISTLIPLHDPNDAADLAHAWLRSIGYQPLRNIMHYLGHRRGFYFAFLGAYTFWLVPVSIVGIFVFRIQQSELGFQSRATLFFGLFVSIWATSFLEYWKRKQVQLAFEWDSIGFEEDDEEIRSSFKEKATPRFNVYADEYEWVYPGYKRTLAYIFSFFSCLGLSLLASVTMFYFLVLKAHAQKEWTGDEWQGIWSLAQHGPTIGYMGAISVFSSINKVLAQVLTSFENHRTESEHRNSLVVKLVTLQFCNYFVSLLYIAFYEKDIPKLSSNAATLLGFYQIMGQVIEIGTPVFSALGGAFNKQKKHEEKEKEDPDEDEYPRVGETDFLLAPQESLFGEYLELWVQFGQVTLFSVVFPLGALFALFNNVIELRTDAFKMLRAERRGIPERASGIGSWLEAFEVLGYIAVMTNVALLGIIMVDSDLGKHYLGGWPDSYKVLLLVLVEHIIIGAKAFIAMIVPDVSSSVAFLIQSRRQSTENELNANFELKAMCEEKLRQDRKLYPYRSTSDQGIQLLKTAVQHGEDAGETQDGVKDLRSSVLLQWILEQEDRRRRAEKYARFWKRIAEASKVNDSAFRFKEFGQYVNIAVTVCAFAYVITKEARDVEP